MIVLSEIDDNSVWYIYPIMGDVTGVFMYAPKNKNKDEVHTIIYYTRLRV